MLPIVLIAAGKPLPQSMISIGCLYCPAVTIFSSLLIETVIPLSQGKIGYQQSIANKFYVGTGQEYLDGAATSSCFIRAQPGNSFEFFDGRVFRIDNE